MQFLFDHALAVVCGAALIVGALTLQTRSQLHAVQETVQGSARAHVAAFADVLSQDFDNTLSESQAQATLGTYRCWLRRDSTDRRTTFAEVPAFIRTAPGADAQPGFVRYELVASGDSVRVGSGWIETYDLMRSVDDGSGYTDPATVGVNIVDFDVTFRGRASETTSGPPPLRFTQVEVELATALPDVSRNEAGLNTARVGLIVRPPNLSAGN